MTRKTKIVIGVGAAIALYYLYTRNASAASDYPVGPTFTAPLLSSGTPTALQAPRGNTTPRPVFRSLGNIIIG